MSLALSLSALLALRWALSSGRPPPRDGPWQPPATPCPTSCPHLWCQMKIKELLWEDGMLVKQNNACLPQNAGMELHGVGRGLDHEGTPPGSVRIRINSNNPPSSFLLKDWISGS